MIDLFIHCGTKFALHQWLAVRGLGENVQDTDATSPTFGDYFYTHTAKDSTFLYWRHPSGKLEATAPVIDGNGDVTTPATFYNGFYGILRFEDFEGLNDTVRTIKVEDTDEQSPTFGQMIDQEVGTLASWIRDSTATSILEGFAGYGGEGITIIAPEDVDAHLEAEGIPGHEILGGMGWSDPRVWFLGPVMTGNTRTFGGDDYTSLVDFNVWTPTQAPQTWELQAAPEPTVDPWSQGGGTGTAGSYNLGDRVTHPNPEESNALWIWESGIPANTTEPGTLIVFNYWIPIGPA